MVAADLGEVYALQCLAHRPDYHETVDVLASHLECGGRHCLVAESDQGLAAYLFAHPWRGTPPVLSRPVMPNPASERPDHLFLHDLAVLPRLHGRGAAARLIAHLPSLSAKCGLAEIRLVALAGLEAFWLRHGWRPGPDLILDRCYGVGACVMTRTLPEGLSAQARLPV